ncbi:MAG: glycosyltransferase family 2 protein [Verrucomicrobiota bacterium]
MNDGTRLPISVCIVAGNEAHRISHALKSVAGWASEIVVVLNDDVSDGTDKIAVSFGAKVFREPWKGFIGQKNSVAGKCNQPWLLNLDADEAVSPELQQEIAAVVSRSVAPCAAYEFPRCSYFCGRWIRHGDWYPDRVQRLWQRGMACWAGDEPHARLEVEGSLGRMESDLFHFSNESIDQLLNKISQFSTMFAHQCRLQKRRAGWTDLAFRPFWKFFRAYVLRLGFLDGWPGYLIAWANAFGTVVRYTKVYEADLTPPLK